MGLLSTIGSVAGTFFGGPVGGAIGGTIGGAIEGGGSSGGGGAASTPYTPRPRPSYMPTQQQYMMPSYYSPVSYGRYQAPVMPQEPVRYVSLNEAAQQYLTQNPDVSKYFNTKLDRNRFRQQYGVTTPEDFALWHYTNWGRKENRMFPSYGGGMFSQPAPQQKPISQGMLPTTEGSPLPGPGPKSVLV